MYKVFFNDRIVFLNDKPALENVNYSKFLEVNSKLELQNLTSKFLSNEQLKSLYLWNNDLQQIKRWFFAQFKIIEAAGGLVFNQKQELLCIHRLGKWDLPKGKIEKGETISEGAIREVEEECGISKPKIEKQLACTFHIYQNKYDSNRWVLKPTYWYLMNYLGSETVTPQTTEAIDKVEWMDSSKIKKIIENTYASLVPVFEEAILHSK